MGNLLLVGLVIAWIIVLGPSVVRRRDERGASSLDAARDRLAAIHVRRRAEPSFGPRGVRQSGNASRPVRMPVQAQVDSRTVPQSRPSQANPFAPPSLRSRTQQRRAQILQILLGSCALSFGLAVATSVSSLWFLHLGTDAVLGSYVLLLRSMKHRSRVRRPRPVSAVDTRASAVPSHGVAVFDYADDAVDTVDAVAAVRLFDEADYEMDRREEFVDVDAYDARRTETAHRGTGRYEDRYEVGRYEERYEAYRRSRTTRPVREERPKVDGRPVPDERPLRAGRKNAGPRNRDFDDTYRYDERRAVNG